MRRASTVAKRTAEKRGSDAVAYFRLAIAPKAIAVEACTDQAAVNAREAWHAAGLYLDQVADEVARGLPAVDKRRRRC